MTHKQFLYWYLGAVQNLSDGDVRKDLSEIHEFTIDTTDIECINIC